MNYHNITKDDMLNGDGLRVVLWTAGCSHGCKGCHNPITWDANGGLLFDEAAKKEIFAELDKNYISGITFSGGDPLHENNREAVRELAEEIKAKYPKKTIWLYTGYEWDAIKDWGIVKSLDVVVDGKFELDKRDEQLHWKGSANQKVIDVKKTRESGQIILHDRMERR
ncbi:anaerobic ribonucleoside-triphosphate reductase activating protein [Konateibacter massiliensis]|uniref:anaerobic ribonucleoside-triphosphate reductase activating protein n=1 Tax=Konateibacter massiliensis TaxID=2002841 RepID=UPI000C14BE88|nr:anaerobic ribonucleoside-triphosphate reductase activating protein [Konateibacter massiliensis]